MIHLLQEGISVNVDGQVHTFYGTVLVMLGDTLAAHDLAGFKVGVGFALRICRDCMATKDMIQEKVCNTCLTYLYVILPATIFQFRETDFEIRNPTTHNHHCSLLEGPLASHDSTTYGVNGPSCLNEIKYFHVANFQMPQDVMHVILEGALPLETRLMLNAFISEDGYFTLGNFNQRVQNFTYGRVEARTKPPKQFEKAHFTGPRPKLHLSGTKIECTFWLVLEISLS